MQQQLTPIISSDNKLFIMPLWKIKESETLHELFLEEKDNQNNPLKTITLPSVSAEKLCLFNDALEQPCNTFNDYFHSLTSQQQRLLIIAAGKESAEGRQLHAACLTAQLLQAYCDQDIITKHICPHLELDALVNYIKQKAIDHTFESQQLTTQIIGGEKIVRKYDCRGYCSEILLSLKHNPHYHCIPKLPMLKHNESESYTIEYMQKRKGKKIKYFITPPSPDNIQNQNDNHKKYIWIVDKKGPLRASKIKHPYPIDSCTFSADGHYVATMSIHPDWDPMRGNAYENSTCLMLTKLGTHSDGYDFVNTILNQNICHNSEVCFNPQSTLLAARTLNGVYLWDINGTLVDHLIDPDYPIVSHLYWNNDGSTLYMLARGLPRTSSAKLIIRNIENHSDHIIPFVDTHVENIFLQREIDTLTIVINNTARSLLVIDTATNSISHSIPLAQSIKNKAENTEEIYALSPQKNFFIKTAASPDMNICPFIQLYDIKSNKCITLTEHPNITGFGFTPDEQSVIVTTNHDTNTLYHLCSNEIREYIAWLNTQPNALQRYTLLKLSRALRDNQGLSLHPQSAVLQTLESLPTAPCNVKMFIKDLANTSSP